MRWPWQRRPRTVGDVLARMSDGAMALQGRWQAVDADAEDRAQRALGIDDFFSFQGVGYSGTPVPLGQKGTERTEANFEGLVRDGLKSNSIIWACERLRVHVFKQARFQFQELNEGRPGDLHGRPATRLTLLDHPWAGGSSSKFLARVRLHSDLAGNAFIVNRDQADTGRPSALRVPRPDWMTIIMGSDDEPGDPNDIDAEIIGYGYWPGGVRSGREPVILLPDEVAHFAPMPDPSAHYIGMSWLNPAVSEFMADDAATQHKLQFFRNGATPQVVVTVDKDMEETAFTRFMRKFNAETRGIANAYKTIYVTGGVDAKVVGADLRQLDFKVTQGAGETRIAACAGTPPILVGLSEGLNAGQYNIYGQAKRSFVDGGVRPDWGELCSDLETIVTPPNGSRLWYDDRDIPYLREDQLDLAQIMRERASAIETLIRAGYKPDAVVASVEANDPGLLIGQHTGLYSVQLLPPSDGTMSNPQPTPPPAPAEQPLALDGKQPAPNGKTPSANGAKQPVPAMGGR